MKKNGFSFIETVVTVVILSTSLLLVYNSYSSIINNEQKRVYYNDPAYIYRTSTVLDFLNFNSDIINVIQNNFGPSEDYVQQVGINYVDIFENDGQKKALEQMINSLSINQIFVVKKSFLNDCSYSDNVYQKITDNIIDCDANNISTENKAICSCNEGVDKLTTAKNFVRTISPKDNNYYLVVEYTEMSRFLGSEQGRFSKCFFNTEQRYGCNYYYAVVPINEVYFV